ncbi:MAG: hypothetical protein N2112_13835 [Gemmataceae bacterium]|nr:hypothetical protein [Gemmataceae bacterium]
MRRTILLLLPALIFFTSILPLRGQEPILLLEKPDTKLEFHIEADSTSSGEILVPLEEGKPPVKQLISGAARYVYNERILPVDPKAAEVRTIRLYSKYDLKRSIGDVRQEISLRPEVKRLVLLKKGTAKIPFSPDGPLSWGEIDLVRRDLLLPAFAQVCPTTPVKPGDTWTVDEKTTLEISGLMELNKGSQLTAKFENLVRSGTKEIATLSIKGTLLGQNEDGPSQQKLDIVLSIDVNKRFINFIEIKGIENPLDDKGKSQGTIEGKFTLTRTIENSPILPDEKLSLLKLEPDDENTLLLSEDEIPGIRFIHSRRWRLGRTTGRQITLDELGGRGGILLTLETADRVPTARAFLEEAKKELQDRKAKILLEGKIEKINDQLERFTLDTEISDRKIRLHYYLIRQANGGATLVASCSSDDKTGLGAEVEKIAKSFTITKKITGKK